MPALVALVGVLAAIVMSARQEQARWRHEYESDRERFVRSERRVAYGRMVALSREVLDISSRTVAAAHHFGALSPVAQGVSQQDSEVRHQWRMAWGDVELIASDEMNACLTDIDQLLSQDMHLTTEMMWADNEPTTDPAPMAGSLADRAQTIERLVTVARLDLAAGDA